VDFVHLLYEKANFSLAKGSMILTFDILHLRLVLSKICS
jgi:hypothetical protein